MANKNILVWVLLLALVVGVGSYGLNKGKATSSVTVVGDGKISVKPEQAFMVVSVVNMSEGAVQAIEDGENAVIRLMGVISKWVDKDTEITKSFYQITPQNDGKYVVANAFSIKTGNVENVNALIKALYENGATTVSNISFTTKNQSETDQNARVEAVKDAKEKAEKLAKSTGKRIGKVLSIADDNSEVSSSVGVSSGETNGLSTVTISKKVSVVYELK